MSCAGWIDVWNTALVVIAAEPVWFQIAIALGAAFAGCDVP